MKLNLLAKTVMKLALITLVIGFQEKKAKAQDRFTCDAKYITTTVQTERGRIPLIRWVDRSFPPPFTPQQRCEIVSARFTKFDNNGTLKYIKADTINNLPVLCIAAYRGGSCLPNGLLVTFKPGTNANEKLIKMLDRRAWAGKPIEFTSENKESDFISRVNGETYINMELFLNWNNTK